MRNFWNKCVRAYAEDEDGSVANWPEFRAVMEALLIQQKKRDAEMAQTVPTAAGAAGV